MVQMKNKMLFIYIYAKEVINATSFGKVLFTQQEQIFIHHDALPFR